MAAAPGEVFMRFWRRIMRLSVLRSLYDSGGIKQPPYELKGLVKPLRATHRQQVLRHAVTVVDVLLADLLDEVLRHRVATPVLHLIRVEAMDHRFFLAARALSTQFG
jgi:hypothetical protein